MQALSEFQKPEASRSSLENLTRCSYNVLAKVGHYDLVILEVT